MDLRMSEWLINDSVLIQKMTNPSILFDRVVTSMHRARLNFRPRLRECCRQGQSEGEEQQLQIHKTWDSPFRRAPHLPMISHST